MTDARPVSVQVWSSSAGRVRVLRTLADTWREMIQYRHLLYQLTMRDIRIRYKQAVMGFGWAILLPILIVLSGIIVRYAMSYLSGTALATDVIAGLAIKAIPWAFFVGAIQFSSGVLIANQNLVTKIYFPREVLPIASVLAQVFDSAIGGIAVVVVLPLLGVTYGWTALWLLPLMACLLVFTLGLSLLLSAANLFFRDVKYIVRVVLTFGIFFTPVFFEPEMFGSTGAQWMMLNPLAPILEGLRLAVIEGHNLFQTLTISGAGAEVLVWSPWYLVYVFALTLFGTAATAVLFHRLEFLFAEYI
ncbi:MAG: ABC transporter permease [Gemmatimonadota bacterium]|nr:ABC transporter permease [Gemmatimonadota bacterium]MDH3427387.1 ABC transporter permease [Gemmatimonadota bacterium]